MCCEVLLMDFQANYFVIDLQGNFVVCFPAHIKWLFLPKVGVGSVLWDFILFQFYCSGCKCEVWKVGCFVIYHVKTFFATKHLFINKFFGDVKTFL
jgi:hypothetical protein